MASFSMPSISTSMRYFYRIAKHGVLTVCIAYECLATQTVSPFRCAYGESRPCHQMAVNSPRISGNTVNVITALLTPFLIIGCFRSNHVLTPLLQVSRHLIAELCCLSVAARVVARLQDGSVTVRARQGALSFLKLFLRRGVTDFVIWGIL